MKRDFLAAALFCTCLHISEKQKGWLILCHDDNTKEYLNAYPKKKASAVRAAKVWLAHRPRQYTVSVKELGYGR